MSESTPRSPSPLRLITSSLAGVVLTVGLGFSLLPHFGVTWDFMQTAVYGERYLDYFSSFDRGALDFQTPRLTYERPYPPTEPDPEAATQSFSAPHLVWPVPYMLGSLSCHLSYLKWQLLDDPYAGHYAANLVLVGLLLGVLWAVTSSAFGSLAAWSAVVLLASYPAFFGHTFNNLRDVPVAILFGLALLSLRPFALRGSRLALMAFTLFFGLALASKTNAILILPIALLYTAVTVWAREGLGPAVKRSLLIVLSTTLAAILAILLWPWMWPWLWDDAFFHLNQHIAFIRQVRDVDARFDFTPLLEVLYTLPVGSLVLAAIGVALPLALHKRNSLDLWFLSVLWFAIPMARICLPRSRNYGGVRHFLEFSPGLFLLAGIAFAWLWSKASASSRPRASRAVLGLLALACLLPAGLSFPYGTSHYNVLIGGPAGAREHELTAAYDFWGNSYRAAIGWLNREAPPHSAILAPIGAHIVRMYVYPSGSGVPREEASSSVDDIWLRTDLQVIDEGALPEPEGDGRVYVLDLLREKGHPEDRSPWLTSMIREGQTPVHRETVYGATMLAIYDLGPRSDAHAQLEQKRHAEKEDLAARLPSMREEALAHPENITLAFEVYQALLEVEGRSEAMAFLEQLLPLVEDSALSERIQRMIIEEKLRAERAQAPSKNGQE